MSGRIPARLDEATKVAVIELVAGAEAGGWTTAAACRYLELSRRRLERWRRRQVSSVGLADRASGGHPTHAITPAEESEIVAVFHEWDTDRSHRKLAHRGRGWAGSGATRPQSGGS